MFIRCPECGFGRELNASQVPDSAVMATCPQCRRRFRFRDAVETVDFPSTDVPPANEPAEILGEEAPPSAPAATPRTKTEDDPLPPGAIIPSAPKTEHQPPAAPTEPQATPRTRPEPAPAPEHEPTPPKQSAPRNDREQHALFTGSGASDLVWESAPLNLLPAAFYQTLLQVLFAAAAFFTRVGASKASLLRPCMFYVLIGTLQSVVQHFWLLARLSELSSVQDPKIQATLDTVTQSLSLPMILISMPPIHLILLVFYAAAFNLMLRLAQPDSANFSVILRVVAYSAAPGVLCVVPVVGTYAASVWFAFCCFVGCKYALNLPWNKTALALLPLYALAVAFSLHVNKMLMSMQMPS